MITARKLVGSSPKRLEDPRLLRGDGRYLADLKLHGMLHAAVFRSPLASARINSIDTAAARGSPGVTAVLTAADLPPYSGLPCLSAVPAMEPFLQPVLASDVVRYAGEPVALVVATSRHAAEDALELIEVEWEPLPVVLSAEAALEPGAPLVHGGSNIAMDHVFTQGDAAVIDAAPHRLRRVLRIQRQAGIPLETRGVAAAWDPARERLTVWCSTQCPHLIRDCVVDFTGLASHQVQVVVPDVGGAFGTKNNVYPEDLAIPLLAQRIGRPVKWVEDRAEHFASALHGREQVHHVEIAYEDDGTIVGIRDHVIAPCGAYLTLFAAEDSSIAVVMLRGPYRIPTLDGRATLVATHTVPVGAFRGVGHSQATFVMERLMDAIARERGIDPVAFRRANMFGPDEMPVDRGIDFAAYGHVAYDSGDYPQALERALSLAGRVDAVAERERLRESGRYLGIGVASYVQATSVLQFETGGARVEPSGAVVVSTGTTGSGQGHPTALAQIAAEQLGVRLEDVRVVSGDTDLVRTGAGAYGSRSAAIAGSAILRSSLAVKAKVLRVAAHLLEASEDDLVLEDGHVHVIGSPQSRVSLAEVAAAVTPGAPLPKGVDSPELDASDHFTTPAAAYAYGTQVAIVEVDVETGIIELRKIALVHDAGPLINPMVAKGQLHGGIALGVGTALLEEVRYTEDGQPPTSFMGYLLPGAGTLGEILLDHMETPTPRNPLGVKGVGESGVVGAAAAVANAVEDALSPFGVEIDELPLTPSRILDLLSSAPRQRSLRS